MNKKQIIEEMVDAIIIKFNLEELFVKSGVCSVVDCGCGLCHTQQHRVFTESENASLFNFIDSLKDFSGIDRGNFWYPGRFCSVDCFKKKYMDALLEKDNYLKLL